MTKKKGNDGRMYHSKEASNGVYRWMVTKKIKKKLKGGMDRSVSPTNAVLINPRRQSANIGPFSHRKERNRQREIASENYLANQRILAENSLRRKGVHINAPIRALDVGQFFDSEEYNRNNKAVARRRKREQAEAAVCSIT